MPKKIRCTWCGKDAETMLEESLKREAMVIFDKEKVFCHIPHFKDYLHLMPPFTEKHEYMSLRGT